MSKTIYCDKCGRIITGEPYVHHIDHKLTRPVPHVRGEGFGVRGR